jgi:hypothetical protein
MQRNTLMHGLLPTTPTLTLDVWDDEDLFPRRPRREVPLTAFAAEA